MLKEDLLNIEVYLKSNDIDIKFDISHMLTLPNIYSKTILVLNNKLKEAREA